MGRHHPAKGGKGLLAILFIILLLSGCSLEYGDGLLSLPKLPGEYLLLQHEIDAILGTGAVYAAAESGANRQAVQLVDIDGDGEDEAIAFFRMPSGEFLVCVYKRDDAGYEEIGRAEGFGNTIRAVHYPRVSESGQLALALSWGLDDAGSYGMTVFGLHGGELKSLMDIQYSSLLVEDIDGDTLDELCFVVRDAAAGRYALRTYSFNREAYRLQSETPLCIEVKSVARMALGVTRKGDSAVYIDSVSTNGGYVTDVVSLTRAGAVNETVDLVSGSGAATWRMLSVSSSDIDGDGVIDIPTAAERRPGDDTQPADARKLNWMDFRYGEEPVAVSTTYHNVSEKWYLVWPEKWGDAVTAQRASSSGISRTTFSVAPQQLAEGDRGEPLLTVCIFTGDNRVSYAVAGGVKIVRQTETSIYGYLLPEDAPQSCALTEEEVESAFMLIEEEWTAGGNSR